MIRAKLTVLFIAMTFAPTVAFADSVSQADQDACTPDVLRLCQDFIPDEAPIVHCLESKRSQLSAACERVIFPPTVQSAQPVAAQKSAKARPHKRRRVKKHPK